MKPEHGYSDTKVAIICHEANHGLQIVQAMNGNLGQPSVMGGLAGLHEDLVAAAIEGVRAIRAGETANPREHHEHWVAFLASRGWQQGPRRPEARVHPNLVPWHELEPGERDKDRVLYGIVVSLTIDIEGRG